MIGKKYGRLTVLEVFKVNNRIKCKCICDCGTIKDIQKYHLLSGATKSCGCLQKQILLKNIIKHNGKGTSLYNRWKAIKQRCLNPQNSRYNDYGGRGISISKDWLEFENFKKWALLNGYSENLVLDRIDNSRGYSPSNCRWTTVRKNNDNRRITVKIENMTLREISEKFNLPYNKIHYFYYKYKPTTINEILIYANQLPIQ